MSATCTVCGKTFPLEPGQATASCPYCYTDFQVRGSKLIPAEDDDNLAPAPPVASAATKKKTKKKPGQAGARVKPSSPRQLVPTELDFADDLDAAPQKKKKKRPSSGSGRPASSSSGAGARRGSAGRHAEGNLARSDGGAKKKKLAPSFEDEISALAAEEPGAQRRFARVVVIATVVLLLGGGVAAYLILNDYFARQSENPMLTPRGEHAEDEPPAGAHESDGTGGSPAAASPEASERPLGPRVPVRELISELHDAMETPSVAGMKRVIHSAEAALTEERLERRERNVIRRIGQHAEQALQSLMVMKQGEVHIDSLERATTRQRQAFELYFAQLAGHQAARQLSSRIQDLVATRSQVEDLQESVREYLRMVAAGE